MHHEASSDCGKTNNSMEFRQFAVQQALNRYEGFNPTQWLGLQAHLTLTVTCTLRNCIVLTHHALLGLDIGGNQISSVYDLSRTSGESEPVTE
jgi:hypothetical protein